MIGEMYGDDPRDRTLPIVCWVARRNWQWPHFYLPDVVAHTYPGSAGEFPAGYRVFYGMVPIEDEL